MTVHFRIPELTTNRLHMRLANLSDLAALKASACQRRGVGWNAVNPEASDAHEELVDHV